MRDDSTIFDEPHYQSLERLAVKALASGDNDNAFAYADRRCRITPPPGPQSYTLRAEVLFQMGEHAAAIADLDQALHLAPDDIAANRRMLAFADGARKSEAALNLISRERDVKILREAIEVLRAEGRRHIAHVIMHNDAVRGWAIWQGEVALEITMSSDTGVLTSLIEADSFHAFADLGRATNFDLRRPKSAAPQSVTLSVAREMIYSTRAPGNEERRPKKRLPKPVNHASRESRPVAIVVPVYADLDSVCVCLESLWSAVAGSSHNRIVLVNDAAPDPRITEYLDQFANHSSVLLLTNNRNLGFVGSINRALDQLHDEDVVLLNSDTIVPKDFVARLAKAASSDPGIGTVTPLSNNGEETSFPVANEANPIGSIDDVLAIDAIAATVNAGRVIDIPNGTGFCLYITRECLDAVGFLSEDFYRGYVEDVDFCLHARSKGFRNVCAPSVYVGHAGSKSFGREKRALVVRNYAVLDRRYPTYQAELAAFNFADPLAPARQAVERAMQPSGRRPRLLLTGSGSMADVADERARQITSGPDAERSSAMTLQVRYEATGPKARIFDSGGAIPQSLAFDLSSKAETDAMIDYVRAMGPGAIEIIDPAHLPLSVVDPLLKLGVPHDIFVGDAALDAGGVRAMAMRLPPDPIGLTVALSNDDAPGNSGERWREIIATAGRIIVPSEQARMFALKHLDESVRDRVATMPVIPEKPRRRRPVRRIVRFGVLPVRSDSDEQGLISAIAGALRSSNPAVAMTVVGATPNDLGLMQIGNLFVSGNTESPDFDRLVKSYGLQALLLAATRPIFGHPTIEAASACGLPIAYFDWSMGSLKPKTGDLALSPVMSFEDMMMALGLWLAKP
jgi:GT2 family glycosyltransferase